MHAEQFLYNVVLGAVLHVTVAQQYIRGCYYTNWAKDRAGQARFVPENYQTSLCTHIFYAFASINANGTIQASDPTDIRDHDGGPGYYQRINYLKLRDSGLKTVLSIGGGGNGRSQLFEAVARSAMNRATFVQSAKSFVILHGFNGIDIDWEFPDKEDKDNFCNLLKELRLAFQDSNLLVSAAVAAVQYQIKQSYKIAEIAKHVDFVNLMTYDFHGSWSAKEETGENSPLFGRPGELPQFAAANMNAGALIWNEGGMPRKKIIIGIATYGRGWTLVSRRNTAVGAPTSGPSAALAMSNAAGFATYFELCQMLTSGATRYWENNQKVPYLVKGDQWFGYDDVQSVGNKMQWIKNEGFGGAFVWTLANDDFDGICGARYPLLTTISSQLRDGTRSR